MYAPSFDLTGDFLTLFFAVPKLMCWRCIHINQQAGVWPCVTHEDRKNCMSLTKELKDPNSSASQWIGEHFDLQSVICLLEAQLQGLDTIRPACDLACYPWATVGNAVEFRLRQTCGVDYYNTTAALGMARKLAMFHDALAVLWDKYKDERWTSAENAWVTYFAGVFEGIFRSGNSDELMRYGEGLNYMETSNDCGDFRRDMKRLRSGELGSVDADNYACLSTLMKEIPVAQEILADIIRVSDAAQGSAKIQVVRHSSGFIDNPVFEGGKWVGGADGDFLVGHTLFEIKTTVRPERLLYSTVRQLLAYVALDARDFYQIGELAILLPRQHGAVIRCEVGQVLACSNFSHRMEMQASAKKCLSGRLQ